MSLTVLLNIAHNLAIHRSRKSILFILIAFYVMLRDHCHRARRRRRSVLMKTVQMKAAPLITFSGGGQLGFYYQGICAFLKDHFVLDGVRFSGISVGSTAAASLAARLPTEASMVFGLRWFKLVANRWLKLFLMNPDHLASTGQDVCEDFGITDDYVRAITDKTDCYYGVTNCSVFPPRHELLRGFRSRYESFYAMSCSMRILPFFRSFGYFRGMLLLDGAFTAFYSVPMDADPSRIIRITVSSRIEADIQPPPDHYFTVLDVFKMPSLHFLTEQFERGYKDAMRARPALLAKGLRPLSEPQNKLNYWLTLLRQEGRRIFHAKDGLERKDYSHLLPQISTESQVK